MSDSSSTVILQSGRTITREEISYIQSFIEKFPALPRSELAHTLCEHLDWLTPSGQPKFTACYKLLSRLEEAGTIRLPPKQVIKSHPGSRRSRRKASKNDHEIDNRAVECALSELKPVRLRMAESRSEGEQWNELVDRHHPLGYKKPFGYPLRYFIEASTKTLGCILLAGPAKALSNRDRWIGWDSSQRLKNLPWILNNTRFLIFPWVRVPHLASHVLGQLARRVADDFEARWEFRPLLMETFVDPEHFAGTCYRAAGWDYLGNTTGRGLVRSGKQYQTSPKLIFLKPLQADFRRLLCSTTLKGITEL